MFVDIETGTIVYGPIYRLPATADLDFMNDSEVIELALEAGEFVAE